MNVKIQWATPDIDKQIMYMARVSNPITHPDLEWRVKPEPKPDVIVERSVSVDRIGHLYERPTGQPNLRYVFDGETGELKKAEVIE